MNTRIATRRERLISYVVRKEFTGLVGVAAFAGPSPDKSGSTKIKQENTLLFATRKFLDCKKVEFRSTTASTASFESV